MRAIEEELETIDRKKDLLMDDQNQNQEQDEEQPDIEHGTRQGKHLLPKHRTNSSANPLIVVNPNVKQEGGEKPGNKVTATFKKGQDALKVIKSLVDMTSTKKAMPFKPSGGLGIPKRNQHKD